MALGRSRRGARITGRLDAAPAEERCALEWDSRFGYTRFRTVGTTRRQSILHPNRSPSMAMFRREDEPRPQPPGSAPYAPAAPAGERRPSTGDAAHIAPGAQLTGHIE